MNVLITGATGLVGKEVGKKLAQAGHRLMVISRNAQKARIECPFPCEVIEGDLSREALRNDKLKNVEAVIHLAGENLAGRRWSKERKKKIHNSRVQGTIHLIESLVDAGAPVKVFVSTSASGYYGDRGGEILVESSVPGAGFLADICRDWERPVNLAEKKKSFPGCRFVILRPGMVISAFGGALPKMIGAFRNGLGGALGDGQQWMGWIHIEDLAQIYCNAVTQASYQGIFNAVAPETVNNHDFSQALAQSFGKRLMPSVPEKALRLALGEMADLLTSSQRIEAQALHRVGFSYRYPQLKSALSQATELFQNGEYFFLTEQFLPYPVEEIFSFFSRAQNLETITPDSLHFSLQGMSTSEIESGTLLDYKLKLHGVPFRWRTEILEWSPPYFFSDTQIRGPYKKWLHTHQFTRVAHGTLMTDLIRYKMPLGSLGRFASGSLVKKDVQKIFDFRRKTISGLNFSV